LLQRLNNWPDTFVDSLVAYAEEITDTAKSGPFNLKIFGAVVAPKERKEPQPRQKPEQKVDVAPSRPDVVEVDRGPDEPPLTIEKVPNSERMKLLINPGSRRLIEAKSLRPPEEAAVEFVFKYGLALITMGLLDTATKTDDWKTDPDKIRDGISKSSAGICASDCVFVPARQASQSRLKRQTNFGYLQARQSNRHRASQKI
jgi:hypothetical protein